MKQNKLVKHVEITAMICDTLMEFKKYRRK